MATAKGSDIAAFVATTLALACRIEPQRVDRRTRLADLDLDSLTFVSILSRVEAVLGVTFSADETLAVLDAPDVDALVTAIERKVAGHGS
jgi:acyl carrier protein